MHERAWRHCRCVVDLEHVFILRGVGVCSHVCMGGVFQFRHRTFGLRSWGPWVSPTQFVRAIPWQFWTKVCRCWAIRSRIIWHWFACSGGWVNARWDGKCWWHYISRPVRRLLGVEFFGVVDPSACCKWSMHGRKLFFCKNDCISHVRWSHVEVLSFFAGGGARKRFHPTVLWGVGCIFQLACDRMIGSSTVLFYGHSRFIGECC